MTGERQAEARRYVMRKAVEVPTPPRVLYGCANKGVAGKGVCKSMKTKGEPEVHLVRDWWEPTPLPMFCISVDSKES